MPSTDAPAVGDSTLLDICRREAAGIQKIACFKEWTRTCVRPLLPHGVLACVHGKTYGMGVAVDYVLTVDFPLEHLQEIRNAAGHMDTPLAPGWFERQEPIFFDADRPPPGTDPAWLASFRKHGLRNAAADGVWDKARCIATYFSFHQLPVLDERALRGTFHLLTPLLHEIFARVIRSHEKVTASLTHHFRLLSEREQEVATYISHGKSNADIASLLGLSETTIKNQVSRILDKTGCSNRAALGAAAIHWEQERLGGSTKVL